MDNPGFSIHEKYMRRALQLARCGALDASPNPMVGAVIVSPDGAIIGEGWHRRCGEGHAEVNAVASVADKSQLRDATMYVTLEPCAHYGKTPPCAGLIVDCGIPRVVIGTGDPFAKVSGRGIAILRDAGVDVTVGCLEEECKELNHKFMIAHSLHRPYVTLKWAESADGYIDGHISSPLTSMLVHRERALHDAILVGSGTWIADKPRLDTRLYAGKSPLKVVLDRRGRISPDEADGNTLLIGDYDSLAEMLERLYRRGVTSVLVEGGAQVLRSFIEAGLWDTIRVERGDKNVYGSVKAPKLPAGATVVRIENIDGNTVTFYHKNSHTFSIRPARHEEAPYLGLTVVRAVGEDIAAGLAVGNHTVDDVVKMFASLAARDDAQYSYRHSLVAVDENDSPIGAIIGYDGALLHELRKRFIEAAASQLGIEFGELDDECEPTEFYLDSLAVDPEWRGRGVATALIRAMAQRASESGKPAGLLVDKENTRARALYERVGFRLVGERPFVHVVMDHLQYPS